MTNLLTGGWLKGHKTYILGILLIAQAIATWAVGDSSWVELRGQIPEILGGMGLMALRGGVSKGLEAAEKAAGMAQDIKAIADKMQKKK